jgi:hypothetical protein
VIPLDVIDWAIDLVKDILLEIVAPAVEVVLKLVFKPIAEAIGETVGTVMSTIATFWVYVPTITVGDDQGRPANDTVSWIWQHTQFIAVFVAAIGIVVGAMQMAWTQRGESARELLRSLMTLAAATAFSVAVAQVLITAGDIFSACIVSSSLDSQTTGWTDGCQQINSADSADFGKSMSTVLGFTGVVSLATGSLALIGIVIAMGILTILAGLIQIVLMVVRSAMLVLLLGVLPIAAAATNTEMGRTWFKRIISWLVAFILYKPVAAIIYATAIRLVSNDGAPLQFDADDPEKIGDIVMNLVTGLTMLVLALFAMPALMRFIVPMVGATAGGAGAGMLAAKMAGVDKVGDMANKGVNQGSDGGGDGPTGAQNVGRASQQAPSGGGGGGGGGGGAAGAGGGEASGAAAAGGGQGAAAGGAAGGGGAAAGGGGAAAGGAAAGAGAAAAVAAPIAVVAAGTAATKAAGQMAASETIGNDEMDQGAQSQGSPGSSGGDSGGPSGSARGGDLRRERDRPRDRGRRDNDRGNQPPPPPDGPSGSG